MKYSGTAVSGGIAIAGAFIYQPDLPPVAQETVSPQQAQKEWEAYQNAARESQEELDRLAARLTGPQQAQAKIFAAHAEFLHDEEITEAVRCAVLDEHKACPWAVESVYDMYAELFAQLEDERLRERAADLRDVKARLLRHCLGLCACDLSQLQSPCVLVAHDLLPSDTACLDREKVLAIVTEIGGSTCHSAIIARGYGIPAVLGVRSAVQNLAGQHTVVVDGSEGTVIVSPTAEELKDYAQRQERFLLEKKETARWKAEPCLTADGTAIDLGINVARPSAEELQSLSCADYIGLFRTEFLYMDADSLPSEEYQYTQYKRLLDAAAGKPVTLRTLDIGGDKTLRYYQLPREENPALGCRALRLCLQDRELFRTQLRAALRASAHGPLRLMFPMVSSLDDFEAARAEVQQMQDQLRQAGIPFDPQIMLGVMIETPSAAILADVLAAHADFASIGTNDLCQYLLAVDRMNGELAAYYQPYSPAVFRLIGFVVEQFNLAGKPISVCGEMGGDPLAAPVLVGLGMRKLSMSASALAAVKKALRAKTVPQLEAMARAVRGMSTAAETERYLRQEAQAQ